MDNGLYVFATPTYANLKVTTTASYLGLSSFETNSSWEFGFGGGLGYKLTLAVSAEILYEKIDGTHALSLGAKFQF